MTHLLFKTNFSGLCICNYVYICLSMSSMFAHENLKEFAMLLK